MDGTTDEDELLPEPPHHELLTERLRLRTARVSDAPSMLPIISQKSVMRWTTMPPVTSLTQAERWMKNRVLGQDVFNFAIELRSTGAFIGMIGCFHPPSVGYIISPDHAGNGYATEALKALVPALFEHLPPASASGIGFDYLEGMTDPDNCGSRRVLEKAGFTLCEIQENGIDHWQKGWRDTVVYRVARVGKSLNDMGLIHGETSDKLDPGCVPPIQ